MTETKQDLQAQIDQLDAEWEQGLDSHKIRVKGSMVLPAQEASSTEEFGAFVFTPIIVLALIAVVLVDYFVSQPVGLTNWLEREWKSLLGLMLGGAAMILMRRSVIKRNAYFDQLRTYESKRSELQGKLDVLG